MTIEVLNLVLGIAGLLLGFISAYAQIKAFASRLLHVGVSAVLRRMEKEEKEARFYLRTPTAFIAYLARSIISCFVIFAVRLNFSATSVSSAGWPEWVATVLAFALPLVVGAIIGSTLTSCNTIIDVARRESGARGAA